MNSIVILKDNVPVTTTLAIAEGINVNHEAVIKLARRYVTDLEEFGTFGFEIQKSGGRPTEYALLNEHQATLLLTYMRNTEIVRKFKKKLVSKFYEMAQEIAKTKFSIPQTMHEALRLAADLEEQRAQLEHKVEEDKPKVQFYEDVGNVNGLTNMTVAAQELGWGRNKLFGKLRLMGIFQQGKTIPYTRFCDQGYFVVKEKVTKNGEWYHQTFVTGKGMQYLHKKLNEEKYLTRTTNNVYNIHAGVR